LKGYSLPNVPAGDVIPRVIYQTFPGVTLPPLLQANVDCLRFRNPEWEHRLFDDASIEAFISEHYGKSVLGYFKRIDPAYGAARADLFRYLVIYRLGGVYLDLKSTFRSPINDWIRGDERFIVSRWRNEAGEPHAGFGNHEELEGIGKEIQQWHVIAAPGHPFLRAVIEAVLDGIDSYGPHKTGVGRTGVLRLTGPIVYSRTIIPLLEKYPCTVIDNETVIGLQYSVLPNMTHQNVFAKHYTRSTSPVVRQRGVRRMLDLGYIGVRNAKRRLQGRDF
jgi:hypothetical protein